METKLEMSNYDVSSIPKLKIKKHLKKKVRPINIDFTFLYFFSVKVGVLHLLTFQTPIIL